jgi:hypothetical protein
MHLNFFFKWAGSNLNTWAGPNLAQFDPLVLGFEIMQFDPQLAAFFTLVLGFEIMQFDPQLINKLLISSIEPLTGFNSSPSIYAPFSILVLGFGFLQLSP